MATSDALREIFTAARPLVEQWLDVAEQIGALREVATNKGLDWSQVKALLKAQIQDERDEAGDGKRVRRIVEKAEFASAYADMLGLANMNEKKYFADDSAKVEVGIPATLPAHDAVTGEIRNEPEAAAEVAGDYLREPAAAEQGQIVREGDAPRETGRFGGDASSPDTEYQDGEAAPLSDGLAGPACAQDAEAANTKPAPIPAEDFTPPAFLLKEAKPLRPHCQRPDLCGGYGKVHCGTCERAAKAKEAA